MAVRTNNNPSARDAIPEQFPVQRPQVRLLFSRYSRARARARISTPIFDQPPVSDVALPLRLLVPVSVPTSPSLASGLGLNPAALPHLLSNSSASQQLLSAMQPQQLLQAAQAAQAQAAQAVQAVQASQQPLLTTSPQQHSHRHTSHINHYTVCDPLRTFPPS